MGKIAASFALLAAFGTAHASFELLLVGDNGANTFETRRIHRFEARTGTYLGSFGGFDGTITNTWLRQSTNSLFVSEAGAITEWDYNTGNLKNVWQFSLGTFRTTVRPDGSRIATFDGLSDFLLNSFPAPSVASLAGVVPGASWRAGIWHSPNRILAFSAMTNQFFNIDMDPAGTSGTAGGSSASLSAGFGQMARNTGTNQFVMAGGTTVKIVDANTLVAGQFSSPFGTSQAAASAHNGFFVGGTNGTTGLITYYDSLGFRRAQFGNSVLRNPVSMEAVLAPEPATLAGLAIGGLALVRRRKRTR